MPGSWHPWPNANEDIRRRVGDYRYETLVLRHFTGPVVVRTLLELDVDPSEPRIAAEIGRLYGSHRDGLWDWEDLEQRVERPVWATLDALRALTEYALRASPAGHPPAAELARLVKTRELQATLRIAPGRLA